MTTSHAKKYIVIIGNLIFLQVLLIFWQMIWGSFFNKDYSFAKKMIMMSGMIILTLFIVLFSGRKNIVLSFFPEKFSRNDWIGTIAALVFLIAIPSNYTEGIKGVFLTLYASIVTPLYEELLFRGYVWNRLESIYGRQKKIIWINAVLFSVWHFGYIMPALIAGEWMALSKLIIGLIYGIIMCIVRYHTKNCYSTFLLHGVLNGFLG